MPFIPDMHEWIRARMEYVPNETAKFCGDLAGLNILDVGCGDMIGDIGLLSLAPKTITGIDVLTPGHDVKENAAQAITTAGFKVSPDYASKLTYLHYDGRRYPFPDNQFDLVYSWGVFEHLSDVPAALREMKRVVKPEGRIFIVVYPWFHCYDGSHLSDFIDEPFFQLSRPNEWVHARLKEYVAAHPDRGPVVESIWPEYCTLNRYSARMFLSAALEAGLCMDRLQCHVDEKHLKVAPPHVEIADVVSAGTTVIFRPGKSLVQNSAEAKLRDELMKARADLANANLQRDQAVQKLSTVTSTLEQQIMALRSELEAQYAVRRGLEQSVSWRLTKPWRDLMFFARKGPRISS